MALPIRFQKEVSELGGEEEEGRDRMWGVSERFIPNYVCLFCGLR